MIAFLYPMLGLAALAAAIPVILHLIRRRETREVTFPAIRYLRQAEQRHARRLRVRHLLLLAARVLIILMLAATAAGPLIGRGGAADHRPTALAILVDASQSSAQLVGERRLLDLYVQRARLALDLSSGDDRTALFSPLSPDAGALAQGVAAAHRYLRDLRPHAATADLPSAIRQATAWLRSAGEGRALEIHVLTDMQRVSLRVGASGDTGTAAEAGDGVAVVVYSPGGEPKPNGALGDAIPEVEPLNAGQQTSVSVPLHWFGPAAPEEPVVVRLIQEDDVIAVAEGRFGASAALKLPPQDSGWVQGYLEIDRQGLADDDRRYFSWFVRAPARVAMVGNAGDFLTHALDALERGGRLSRVAPARADVWVTEAGERVAEGLADGRSVIVVPPVSPLDLPRLNSRLDRARIPWRYEPYAGARGASRVARGAPIEGLSGLEVRRFYRLVPIGITPGDTALLRLGTGEPWVVRGTMSAGAAYVLLASPLDPEASALPVSAGMVPFVDAAVGDWARRGQIARTAFDGSSPVRLPARAREVRLPDGAVTAVEGGAWFRPGRAGNYVVLGAEGTVMAFSVNAPAAEADLARGRPQDLEAVLPAASWSWSRSADPKGWENDIFKARRGRLAWRPLVVLLILCSIVEANLAAAGRRRAARPGHTDRDHRARTSQAKAVERP